MKTTESYRREHYVFLLFMFLFGALMTLLYLPPIKEFIPDNEYIWVVAFAVLLLISSLLVSSLNGIVLLPLVSVFFGATAALELERIRVLIEMGEKPGAELAFVFVFTPVYFWICNWGMRSSSTIRECMHTGVADYRKKKVCTYSIILFGAAFMAAVIGLIII